MKHLLISLFASACLVTILPAQSISYPIDASHSVISFSVGFAGGITSIDGRFDDYKGNIGYTNTADRSTFFVEATIDVKSINTGDKDRDKDLLGKGYFNAEEFPEITFKSKRIIKTSKGYSVIGAFSMMGKTSEKEIPFTFKHNPSVVWIFGEPRIAMQGTLKIDRAEYGIPKRGWDNIVPSLGSISLSKQVNVKLVIQGVGPSLSTLILEEISKKGVKSAINLYKKLEKQETDKGTYTFGDRTLVGVVMQLTRDGNASEAVTMGEFTTNKYADSFLSWYVLAMSHEAAGNKEKAIQSYVKTLKLNPKFSRAQLALDKLKE